MLQPSGRQPLPSRRSARARSSPSSVRAIGTALVGAIFGGKGAFGDLTFTLHRSVFRYGHFINALITFVAIAAVVFVLVVKPMNYLLARMKRGQQPVSQIPADVQLLTEIRDL